MRRVASAGMQAMERSSLDGLLASCMRAVRRGRGSTVSGAGCQAPPSANFGCWQHVPWPTARDAIGLPGALVRMRALRAAP